MTGRAVVDARNLLDRGRRGGAPASPTRASAGSVMRVARRRRRRLHRLAPVPTRCSARGDEVVAVDNFVTGRRANIAHLADHERFTLVEHDVTDSAAESRRPVRRGACDLASPASPVDFATIPLEILAVGSHRHAQPARPRRRPRAPASSWPRPARCTATRWCTRSPRRTGATSARSARAAATTRPSASPRR